MFDQKKEGAEKGRLRGSPAKRGERDFVWEETNAGGENHRKKFS